eukprot:CAMPEP_0175447186 /NCGR_PEP_ID=MMETSP0095-20121207/60676_1 /TAXON_ID=311494 /ORGANISM="Alexandrium monilatum, Strain CCMP3105" /LENGTH=55 /DNA_ID=CAMNT_0016747523 /DNA_START=12 /DNA_END=176 /DNA_ORIENTATION=+
MMLQQPDLYVAVSIRTSTCRLGGQVLQKGHGPVPMPTCRELEDEDLPLRNSSPRR